MAHGGGSSCQPAGLRPGILTGLIGVGLTRFKPAGMARAAFATALATFIFWPFVPIVVVSGRLFRTNLMDLMRQ